MSYLKHIFHKDAVEEIKLEDIQRLIDKRVEEFNQLDYKGVFDNKINFDNIAKCISGFLNTSGGLLIIGVSEKIEDKHHYPDKITWTTSISKENIENNLFSKIQPWHEDTKIIPIENPENRSQMIFLIIVPKSSNPPHMANFTYYLRLNFQTKPMTHDQVVMYFRQNYLLKQDLIKNIYNPIYSEVLINRKRTEGMIKKLVSTSYDDILRNNAFLLSQDIELWALLENLMTRIKTFNSALDVVKFRLANLINTITSSFLNQMLYNRVDYASVSLKIVAESTTQNVRIDNAILNGKDPLALWRENNPFAKIINFKIKVETKSNNINREYDTEEIPDLKYKKLLTILFREAEKDDLISYIRREYKEIRVLCDEIGVLIERKTK